MSLLGGAPEESFCYAIEQISERVFAIREHDEWGRHPLMYLIKGDQNVALIDTGCGSGNLLDFVVRNGMVAEKQKLVVINTHNHAEQTGANWQFSTTGKLGMAHQVVDLCASLADTYYTKTPQSSFDWDVRTYKITRWLGDNETVLLGPEQHSRNVLRILYVPGHTPDSLAVWYEADARLFVGGFFHQFTDINLTYEFSSIKALANSAKRLLDHVSSQPNPREVAYSAAAFDVDAKCLPIFKNFYRFLMAIVAGAQPEIPLRIDEHEGSRFETRDKAIRVVLSRTIVEQLKAARQRRENKTV
ncbi:hypothetical protein QR680_012571 [Steinernema hermaphroditum]|uniref:Metallo-beta-lactamase domain-containing protein n=1 Tax=Steinernema hermaphroditum TaxID=289476 RepID=A0AA39I4F3_9BILA|nr:hypothetical protein QR680_012571 [Steinernema hermaphroditum]